MDNTSPHHGAHEQTASAAVMTVHDPPTPTPTFTWTTTSLASPVLALLPEDLVLQPATLLDLSAARDTATATTLSSAPVEPTPTDPNHRVLMVRHLPETADEAAIGAFLERVEPGTVEAVHIAREATGASLGYALITYTDHPSAARALLRLSMGVTMEGGSSALEATLIRFGERSGRAAGADSPLPELPLLVHQYLLSLQDRLRHLKQAIRNVQQRYELQLEQQYEQAVLELQTQHAQRRRQLQEQNAAQMQAFQQAWDQLMLDLAEETDGLADADNAMAPTSPTSVASGIAIAAASVLASTPSLLVEEPLVVADGSTPAWYTRIADPDADDDEDSDDHQVPSNWRRLQN